MPITSFTSARPFNSLPSSPQTLRCQRSCCTRPPIKSLQSQVFKKRYKKSVLQEAQLRARPWWGRTDISTRLRKSARRRAKSQRSLASKAKAEGCPKLLQLCRYRVKSKTFAFFCPPHPNRIQTFTLT